MAQASEESVELYQTEAKPEEIRSYPEEIRKSGILEQFEELIARETVKSVLTARRADYQAIFADEVIRRIKYHHWEYTTPTMLESLKHRVYSNPYEALINDWTFACPKLDGNCLHVLKLLNIETVEKLLLKKSVFVKPDSLSQYLDPHTICISLEDVVNKYLEMELQSIRKMELKSIREMS